MNPRTSRTLLVVVALGAVVIALLTASPKPVVTITYAYSPDAAALLKPLITEFNASKVEAGGGTVKVVSSVDGGLPSGKARDQIDHGSLKPVAWTPASSMWGQLLDAKRASGFVEEQNRSLVQSPQVVAMFKSADNHGLSSTSGLEDIFGLAVSNDLKLVHTDPNSSTSGLSAVLAEFYLKAGRPARLEIADVARADPEVQKIEGSIAHYVDVAKDIGELWCNRYGRSFADASYMQETTFLELNKKCHGQLMAVYPSDVTFVADYPYIVLDAPWVDAQQREAAQAFGAWLDERLATHCHDVVSAGFRKDACVPPEVKAAPPLPSRAPRPPDPKVLAKVLERWGQIRRPASVMLVVDESLPMARASRFALLKQAVSSFPQCPRSQDKVGLMAFGGGDSQTSPVALAGYTHSQRDTIDKAIQRLAPGGGRVYPRLWDAMDHALEDPAMREPSTINTVVVLSLGADYQSDVTVENLKAKLLGLPVQIVSVAYGGAEGNARQLKDLVEASLGRAYPTKATDVDRVSAFVCQFL